jgi:hypothetical protein
MPARAQLIHVAEGEKEAFVPVIALRVGRGSLGTSVLPANYARSLFLIVLTN